jgi:lysophospholipase L1-like esterase
MILFKDFKLSLALMGISLLITLLLAELLLSFLKIPQLSYGDNLPLIYETDDKLGYRFIPNAEGIYKRYFEWESRIKINSHGWRDYEYQLEKPLGGYRIVVIGDSFTVNMEVPLAKTYSKVLERLLRENVSDKIEVLNFSVDGTGTDYHYKVFKDISLKYNPDLLIHAFFYNDIADVQVGKLYRTIYRKRLLQYRNESELTLGKKKIDQEYYTRWGTIKHTILRNSFLARLLMYPFGIRWPHFYLMTTYSYKVPNSLDQYLSAPSYFPDYQKAVEKTKELIQRFKELADRNGIQYLLMSLYDKSSIKTYPNYINKLFGEVIRNSNIEYLNLFDTIHFESQKQQLFWKHDNHLNTTGCRLVAENLYQFLLNNKFLYSNHDRSK